MGSDMTNLEKSNLKVPPLKIVLSSATSGGSDRSTSTSPSSESESLDSNLTIISENQQERNNRSDLKEEAVQGKFDKASRHTVKGNPGGGCSSLDQKVSNSAPNATVGAGGKRSHQEQSNDVNNFDTTATAREPSSSSNQRITRSSQRAAQQNKSDNCNETNGDDTNLADSQDKSSSELGQRKVKRRKAEQAEASEENNQQVQQQPTVMANICPANYLPPSQNSFELYRDIRNRPHMKLMKLNLVPPKVPHGFKNYIIYGGPYLLEGNKVGLGLSGGRIDSPENHAKAARSEYPGIKTKISSSMRRPSSSQISFNQRHSSYIIPKPLEAPKNLKPGSPLFKLYQDQELARQKMRMQHLKERERTVLTSEQEILRAYNRVTIANNEQSQHLSACTYFFYQERYHYVDEKSNYLDSINPKDSTQNRENSDSCNAENAISGKSQVNGDEQSAALTGISETTDRTHFTNETNREAGGATSVFSSNGGPATKPSGQLGDQEGDKNLAAISDSKKECDTDPGKPGNQNDGPCNTKQDSNSNKQATDHGDFQAQCNAKPVDAKSENGEKCLSISQPDVIMSESDLKGMNRAEFLNNLQEIDNKWAKIKDEMFIRHKNESDSLYAVQCLEWEWKAKETGACDVRLSMRVDAEFVPKVTVSALDY